MAAFYAGHRRYFHARMMLLARKSRDMLIISLFLRRWRLRAEVISAPHEGHFTAARKIVEERWLIRAQLLQSSRQASAQRFLPPLH